MPIVPWTLSASRKLVARAAGTGLFGKASRGFVDAIMKMQTA